MKAAVKKYGPGIVFLIVALAVFFIVLCSTSVMKETKNVFGSIAVGERGEREVSSNGWTTFSYANAPEFDLTTFDGEGAYYYELDCGADEQYAMDAYVTSPALLFYETDYVLGFKYFTRQRESTPNALTVSRSLDGETFVECGRYECFDSGSELETWRSGQVEVNGAFRYLRFTFTVYYAGTGSERIDKSGLYLSENFTLEATKAVETPDESACVLREKGTTDLYYNGEEQYPSYEIEKPSRGCYVETYTEKDGVKTKPIASGTYDFCAAFYDDVNELVCVKKFSYTIKKQTIELQSYQTVANARYIVLLDAVFTDGAGREVGMKEAGVDRVYRTAADFNIQVKNDGFEPYTARLGRIVPNAQSSAFLYYLEDKDVTATYDGGLKSVSEEVVTFDSYDFETGTFHSVASGLTVEYYADGEKLPEEPVDAGTYGYKIILGSSAFEGTFTVLPKEIVSGVYEGTESLDKTYDGNDSVAFDGEIVRVLNEESLSYDFVPGDDVSIRYERVAYARDSGETYLLVKNPVLQGENASNYLIKGDIVVNTTARIAPTTLYWAEMTDKNGNEVRIVEREYDGTTDATIEGDEKTEVDMKGLGNGKVTYGDLTATLDGADSGERKVLFTLTNAAKYDKYLPNIITGSDFYYVLQKRRLTNASATGYDGTEKTYDGTTACAPNIYELDLGWTDDYGDGLAATFAASSYAVYYERAYYLASSASESATVRVENVTFSAFDAEAEKIFSNYRIEELTLSGRILRKQAEVITETVRIFVGQALPIIETTASGSRVATSVYATEEDAENGTNRLPDTTAIAETGDYFIKVELLSNDYELVGRKVVPLAITAVESKENRYIVVDAFDRTLEERINVPYGGWLDLQAYTVDESGRKTGEPVSMRANGADVENGVLVFRSTGAFSVTLTCLGDSYYNDATPVTISGTVTDQVVGATVLTEGMRKLLVDEDAPTGEYLEAHTTFTLNDRSVEGTLKGEKQTIAYGANPYTYTFSQKARFAERAVDLQIYGDAYEYDGASEYVLTTDERYDPNKIYYRLDIVSVSGTDVTGTYEESGNGFVLTNDTTAQEGKEYYVLTATKDETNVVKSKGYYYSDGENYVELAIGEIFSDRQYYGKKKDMYGEKEVTISLTGEKPVVTYVLGGTADIPYGARINIKDVVVGVLYEGVSVPMEEMKKLNVDSRTYCYVETDEGIVSINTWVEPLKIGTYRIGEDTEEAGSGFVMQNGEGNLVLETMGSADITIVKSDIVIRPGLMQKYYFKSAFTEEELKEELSFDGYIANGDLGAFTDAIKLHSSASATAVVGDYNVTASLLDGTDIEERYNVSFDIGYVTVIPIPVTVTATTNGHVYGRDVQEIAPKATVTVYELDRSERDEAEREVEANVLCEAEVTSLSNVGEYPIDIEYIGDIKNFSITFKSAYYAVTPANITGVYFEDRNVLYDGERHSLEIEYDRETLGELTVRYNNGYFVESGVYEYVATVSKNNYFDLTLNATLIIGTLHLSGSSTEYNAVSVSFSADEYTVGLNPNIVPLLVQKTDEEKLEQVKTRVQGATRKSFTLGAVYDVVFSLGTERETLGFGEYTVTVRPDAVKYADNLKIYGYTPKGEYTELDFEYKNGAYEIQAGAFGDIAFVFETKVKEGLDAMYVWIFVAIIAVVAIIVLAILFGGGGKRRRERRRSRRRHHRWA